MKPFSSPTRRGFLKATLAAAVAPQIIPSRLLGADAPSNRIQLGHIGTGGQGTGLLRTFMGVGGSASMAIADPFRERRERAGGLVKAKQGHEPKLYADFREMLADKSIDAVVIATPDHWHVPAGLASVRAGKDVYIEKPLGYTLNQNRAMLEAVKKHERIFQYGTQQRGNGMIKRGVELVLNGHIGDLQRIEVWCPRGEGGGSLQEIPVPEGLDYDLYIGPAPMKPCTKDRITNKGSWFCSDYAIGFIAGWGAHPLDVAIWGSDFDQKGPVRFRGKGDFPTPDALFNTCATWDVEIQFPDLSMRFMSDNHAKDVVGKYRKNWESNGTTFHGSKGWVSLSRGSFDASDADMMRQREPEGDRRLHYRPNYWAAFLESVRERSPSVAPIEDAVRSDALSHLSLLAIQSGKEVVWDPKGYRVESPEEINDKMGCEVRGPWEQV